ncbi:MAG: hypothetical protein A2020_06435 [Lentisphaerae bacterium GWF2_45_14]|nr:MAG: hypothetical protein A2020_06435 [Lentisphaerae bacterium GWF2_45_14]
MKGVFLQRLITISKFTGIALLVLHFSFNVQDFEKVNPRYIILYMAFAGGFSLLWLVFHAVMLRIGGDKYREKASEEDIEAARSLSQIIRLIKKEPWQLFLIPGEDGLFFLPLLYMGINPLTALGASLLFGFAHIGYKSRAACAATSAIAFMICVFVIPYGIINAVIGHLAVDLSVFSLLPFINMENREVKKDEQVVFVYPDVETLFPSDIEY